MKDDQLTIISNEPVAAGIYKMMLEGERLPEILPGQFLNLKLPGRYLRRPISICDWTDSFLTILYKVVGEGTRDMSRMETGETLSALLPLGNGFDVQQTGERPLLAGGGVGVPPLYGLAKRMLEQDIQPTIALGFNRREEVILAEAFERLGTAVRLATADGSRGQKGFVTNLMDGLAYTSVYACGPVAMLQAINQKMPADTPGFFSFEERMGCGFGACMGCSCKTKNGAKRICKEGPVLERSEILW